MRPTSRQRQLDRDVHVRPDRPQGRQRHPGELPLRPRRALLRAQRRLLVPRVVQAGARDHRDAARLDADPAGDDAQEGPRAARRVPRAKAGLDPCLNGRMPARRATGRTWARSHLACRVWSIRDSCGGAGRVPLRHAQCGQSTARCACAPAEVRPRADPRGRTRTAPQPRALPASPSAGAGGLSRATSARVGFAGAGY